MTEKGGKTGTPQIVWATVLFVIALIGIIQMPVSLTSEHPESVAGAIFGTLAFAIGGVLLLLSGLKRRRLYGEQGK